MPEPMKQDRNHPADLARDGDRGVNKFTWLMIRFMLVVVPLVFIIYGSTKHDWQQDAI